MSAPLRVVLVEDSLVQRAHLSRVLQADGDIVVVAEASDAQDAARAVEAERPDVVTMDLQLPGGGGRAAIERIMADSPVPVLVLSGIIDDAFAQPAVEALAAGAVDAMPKPTRWTPEDEHELRRAVRRTAGVHVVGRRPASGPQPAPAAGTAVIAIAASTGGPAALTALLRGLEGVRAPILIVQHIHPAFVGGFVTWLAGSAPLGVRLASAGAALEPGTVHVAPGDVHLLLGPRRRMVLEEEPSALHRPSGDVLLRSVAEQAGAAGIGIVLTGMGDDGAAGLLALREAGGRTFAQDQASCTVFGMPRAAQEAGATDTLLPPQLLATAVLEAVEEVRAAA
jgi:two-component system, chemotaxis family, protein-glutamate methylesterase/glutaminase